MELKLSEKVTYPFKCRDKYNFGCSCEANNQEELLEKFSVTFGGYRHSPRLDCKACVARHKRERIASGTWYGKRHDYSPEDYPGGGLSCFYR